MKKLSNSFAALLVFICIESSGQDCNCDFVFQPTQNNSNGNTIDGTNPAYASHKGGDVFCIMAGTYNYLRFRNFNGSEGNPVIFKNCGGKAIVERIEIVNSRYTKVSGRGDSAIKYGIKITGSNSTGITVRDLSSDAEIENLEVTEVGFAGIMAKTDPLCEDPNTWRENFTFYNLYIHDNWVHDTEGEGMYIGYTGGVESSKLECGGVERFGHTFNGIRIYNNLIERTGWDGFQLSQGLEDVMVFNNVVRDYGLKKEVQQYFGWSIGGGTGRFFNNMIIQSDQYKVAEASAVQIISNFGPTYFYNNVIVNAGKHGIFIHNRLSRSLLDMTKGYYFINNTLYGTGASAFFYNSCSTLEPGDCKEDFPRVFHNNLIVNPGSFYENLSFWKKFDENFVDFISKELRDAAKPNVSNNYFTYDIEAAKLTFPGGNNMRPLQDSPLIDAGLDVATFGVVADFDNAPRPKGVAWDIGAFEYKTDFVITDVEEEQRDAFGAVVYPNPSPGVVNIEFETRKSTRVSIIVHDMTGRQVSQILRDKQLEAGKHNYSWDGSAFKGSMLILSIAGNAIESRKRIIIK